MDWLLPLAILSLPLWTVTIIVDAIRRYRQMRLATEFHGRLLERIGSVKELAEFLGSEGGAKFLDSLTIEREGRPQTRIVHALQSGIVLSTVGLGVLTLATTRSFSAEAEDGLMLFAAVAVSVGIGLLLSAAASFFVSKRLRLLDADGKPHGSESSAAR